MDSKDRPETNVPAVPVRIAAVRPAVLDTMSYGRTATPEPGRSVNVLRATLRAITRHWWQILLLWAVGTGGLCYLVMTQVKPKYASEALLRVEPARADLFNTNIHSAEHIGPFMETQVQLIRSPNVLSAALADPKIAAQPSLVKTIDAEGELRNLIDVSVMPNSFLLRVEMKSESPNECADIVNAVVNSYLKANLDWTEGATKGKVQRLEEYQRELIAASNAKQDELVELHSKGNIDLDYERAQAEGNPNLPVPTKNKMTAAEYRKIKDDVLATDLELAKFEAMLSVRQEELKQGGGDGRLQRRMDQIFRGDRDVADLLSEMERLRKDYEAKARLTRNPNDPSLTNLKTRFDTLKARYDQLYAEREDELVARVQEEGNGDLSRSLREIRDQVEGLKRKKEILNERLSQIEVINRTEGTDAVKAALVREALASINAMKDSVQKILHQLTFEQKGEARISLVNPAKTNFIPVSDSRKKLLAATPVGVLLFVLGLFVLFEVKVGRVSDLEDLSKQMPVEVFPLPPLPGPRLEPGQRGSREREARLQEFLQSLDHLRVALCDEHELGTGQGGRCLLITSATAAEGKTTLAAQLSACCAKAGISTLLIDADMRRATLSRMLNEEKSPGLSDVLQGDLTADEAAVAIPDAGFHLLPAGTTGRDPSWLLRGQKIGQLLVRYRQLFDLVIIDTPPVLPVPDALTVGRWADGAVLTTRFDVSRFPMVDKARRRIATAGIPLLTTVVNGVRTSRFYYGYGSYGYGYGGYGGYAYGDRKANPPETTPANSA